ncbi:MAG: organic hydroperoxide resistance protein, partial [Sphingobacteriales bacterium]
NHTTRLEKVETGVTSVTAKVSIGSLEGGTFGLAVELAVNIPGVSIEEAQRLTERAHQVCPYSNATRNNIVVELTSTNN